MTTQELPAKQRVALGMSGGVDSSLCAHLLVDQGYDVTGVYLECWRAPGCRTEEDRKDALAVALSLNIPFTVLDFKETYREKVVENFFAEYAAGRTPNPDVLCNKEIKFGLFYNWALEHDFDFVATGHYADIIELPTNTGAATKTLAIPKDTHKDQTYFLYLLQPHQLSHVLFPLAGYTKTEVRKLAQEKHLSVANKKDSVGICFIGDINVHEFLRERLGENPGAVVNTAGEEIGTHQGLWFYTIGQRHGFTIQAKTKILQKDGSTIDRQNIPPFYVVAKKPAENQLVVGFGTDTLSNSFTITQAHWLVNPWTDADTTPLNCLVRIRHTGELLPCEIERGDHAEPVEQTENNEQTATPKNKNMSSIKVTLSAKVKGVAEGQSAVFYQEINTADGKKTIVLGGGVITDSCLA
jgi:tRNA-uridine 2-sulfurtransferase